MNPRLLYFAAVAAIAACSEATNPYASPTDQPAFAFGTPGPPPDPGPPPANLRWTSVSAGGNWSCGLAAGGQAYCWGDNDFGQLGNGTTTRSGLPVPVLGNLRFALLEAGGPGGFGDHACGITVTGTAYCWGRNDFSQLGAASSESCGATAISCSTTPLAVAGGLTFSTEPGSLDIGQFHSCAITASGAAHCWGMNAAGQLGNGAPSQFEQNPVPVGGGHIFSSITAGNDFTCGLTTTGVGLCWGDNDGGQLGNGTQIGSVTPQPVSGAVTFSILSAGGLHACAITSGGNAYCWGANGFGALGSTTAEACDDGFGNLFSCSTVPLPVGGGVTFATTTGSIAAGLDHTCGVATTGSAYCWGRGDQGQLGNGGLENRPGPSAVVGVSDFTAIHAGQAHSCGVTQVHLAYCWGAGGPLGDGTPPAFVGSTTPVRVGGAS